MIDDVSFVVVNYRTQDHLDRFLDSVERTAPGVRTIVMHAYDEPGEHVPLQAHAWARHVPIQNRGYAFAVNSGMSMVGTTYAAIFNADVVLHDGAVATVLDTMQSDPRIGVAGPRQVCDGRIVHGGIKGDIDRGWLEPDLGTNHTQVDDVDDVRGSAYFVRTAVWDHLASCSTYMTALSQQGLAKPVARQAAAGAAGFLPTKLWYEETWMSWHARRHGYRVVYVGAATVTHNHHASIDRAPQSKLPHVSQSKALYDAVVHYHSESA